MGDAEGRRVTNKDVPRALTLIETGTPPCRHIPPLLHTPAGVDPSARSHTFTPAPAILPPRQFPISHRRVAWRALQAGRSSPASSFVAGQSHTAAAAAAAGSEAMPPRFRGASQPPPTRPRLGLTPHTAVTPSSAGPWGHRPNAPSFFCATPRHQIDRRASRRNCRRRRRLPRRPRHD